MKLVLIILLLISTLTRLPAQTESKSPRMKVAILLYPGVELLDFAGPTEVFSLMDGATVFTVAPEPGPLTVMKKTLTVQPDYSLANCPKPDILVVPGASPDHIQAMVANKALMKWIRQVSSKTQITMSVCTGAYLLANVGLLDNKTVTTHWASTEMLQQMTPRAKVMEHVRFVDQGSVVTTAGVSAGIDGALQVVSRLKGAEAARSIARIMEYDNWHPGSGLVIGKKAGVSAVKHRPSQGVPTAVKVTKPINVKAAMLSSDTDPVCHMSVSSGVADTAHYAGKRFGFCSKICKQRFGQNPTAYMKRY
ncbi:DJ-1/PfpI family protein [Spirosoma arcticum]